MSYKKGCLLTLFVVSGLGFLLPHLAGKLYPLTNITFTTGIVLVIILSWKDDRLQESVPLYILTIVALAVTYRLQIFLFPASMIGIDPDGYAIQMARVVGSGDLSAITFGFYSQAPFHFLLGIFTSLVASIPTPVANIIFPLISGITVPLLAAVFTQRLRPNSPKTTVLAAGGVSVLGYSVRFSYLPVAQSTGTLFLLFTVFSMLVYVSNKDRRWLVFVLLTMVGALYTHKLSAIAIALSLSGALFLGILHPKTRKSDEIQRLSGGTIGIIGLLTVVQIFYVTGFGSTIIYRLIIPETVTIVTTFTPTNATDPYTLTDRLFRLSYIILLGTLSGLVWLGALWATLQKEVDNQIVLFLGLVAPLAGLVVLLYPLGVNPTRTIFYSEALLVILIAICWYWSADEPGQKPSNSHQYGKIIAVLLLITTAGISPIVGPDWDSSYRSYLTTEEVEAKEWGLEMVPGEITTDQYYAIETPPTRISGIEDNRIADSSKFSAGTETYLNNTFSKDPPSVVAHRSCIEILRSSYGVWKLTYNPDEVLNQDYNQVYDSGCVAYFLRGHH